MKKILLGLLILSLAVYGYAQTPQGQQSYYKLKFLGVNPRLNPKLLPDDNATDCSNITLDEAGAIKDRETFGQYNSAAGLLGLSPVTGIFKLYTPTSKYFIGCAGSNVALGLGGAFTTNITPTTNTVTSGTFWSATTFNNSEYMFNPSVPMMKYDTNISRIYPPGTAASGTPATNCAYGTNHKNRVWAMRSDSLPFRMYFSSLYNGDDWTTTGGYIDLPDLTQSITGCVSWGGYLWIFTETNIYVLQGSTPYDFSLRKTNSVVGVIAPRSIRVTDIGIILVSRTGVFAFDGNNSTKLSDKVEPIILSISPVQIQNACGAYDGTSKYWLSYAATGSTYNNKILIYDTILKEWYPYDNLNINCFERAYGGTDKGELYGGSSTFNGIVYQLQSSTGTESVTYSSLTDFNNLATFNTVVTTTPSITLNNYFDSFTKLLSHFNGSTGQTPTPATTNQTLTYVAGSQVSTVPAPLPLTNPPDTAALFGNGASDYVTVPDSADWAFGAGDFTMDFFIYQNIAAGGNSMCGQYLLADPATYFHMYVNGATEIILTCSPGGTIFTTAGAAIGINTWYHIAVVRYGATTKLYVNGVEKGSGASVAWVDYTSAFRIGGSNANGTNYYFNGYIDEFRISKGVARWTAGFIPPTKEYSAIVGSGTSTSPNIQINAASSAALSTITWTHNNPANTKISFQTRTGATNDTVNFNKWVTWSSANTVAFDTVSGSSSQFQANQGFSQKTITVPATPQTRNILYYETDDSASPNCVQFAVNGIVSKNSVVTKTITPKDLSTINWLSGWYQSPQTGNTVTFSFGQTTATENTTTFNTVTPNTWEKWYWYIGGITPASKAAVSKLAIGYVGDAVGSVYIGDSLAQNYYEIGDTMSSTPNDWIEFRGIFGSTIDTSTPELNSVTLMYVSGSSTPESSLSSYYQTKWIDFSTPQISKQYTDFLVDVYTEGANNTFYFDWDIDNGTKTGTITIPSTNTVTNNMVKLHKYFPSSTFGNTLSIKYRNPDATSAKHRIRGMEIRCNNEPIR